MTIQAVIFDVGGVLIRTEQQVARRKWEVRLGLPDMGLSQVVFDSQVSARAMVGQASTVEVWKDVTATLGLNGEQMQELEQDFWSGDQLDAELAQFMRGLRPQYKTGILSNAWPDAHQALTQKYELGDAADVMILSAEVGCAKPDPHIYGIVLERLGVRPEEAVFVDDVLENVEAARALGMRGVQFKNTLQTITELKRYLNGYDQA